MLIAIYLNDHLAGATAGRELARRAAASNRGTPYEQFLQKLADQVDEDRNSLLTAMRSLGIRVDRVKVFGGWGAEKLGRLKLNGRLRGYSPLSRVVELEALALGVHGKLAMWRSLEAVEPTLALPAGIALPELTARAEAQLDELETYRLRAVADALSPTDSA